MVKKCGDNCLRDIKTCIPYLESSKETFVTNDRVKVDDSSVIIMDFDIYGLFADLKNPCLAKVILLT